MTTSQWSCSWRCSHWSRRRSCSLAGTWPASSVGKTPLSPLSGCSSGAAEVTLCQSNRSPLQGKDCLLFYILVRFITKDWYRIVTAHSCWLYSAVLMGDQAASAITSYPTQWYYRVTGLISPFLIIIILSEQAGNVIKQRWWKLDTLDSIFKV